MKILLKIDIIFFMVCLFISCNKSIYVDNDFSNKRILVNDVVSFGFGMPGIIIYDEKNSLDMKFLLDTGSLHSGLFEPFFSIDHEISKKKNIDFDYIRGENISMEYGLKIFNEIYNDEFFLLHKNHEQNFFGLLGITFFSRYKVITIDYKKKQIVLNDNILNVPPIKMSNNEMGHLTVPVKFNGKNIDCILDTGCGYDGKHKFIIQPKPVLQNEKNYISENNIVELGEIKYRKIYAIYVSADDLFIPPTGDDENEINDVVNNLSLIGASFFDGHIIQFDMENMEFRIL